MHECMELYIIQTIVQGIQDHTEYLECVYTEYLECVYTNGKKYIVLLVLWLSVLGSCQSVSVALRSSTALLGMLLAWSIQL